MQRSIAGSFRVYVYIRVSTRDQAEYGTSLDGQRERGSKFCTGEGYPDPEVRIEVESAGEEKQERRIEMNRLLKELRSGDVLVCKDLSRWCCESHWFMALSHFSLTLVDVALMPLMAIAYPVLAAPAGGSVRPSLARDRCRSAEGASRAA